MLSFIARWGHNVLLVGASLLARRGFYHLVK